MIRFAVPTIVASMVAVAIWKFAERGLSGETIFLREDTFWSWSSGFARRGLPGEIIYRLDLLTGVGQLLFAALLVAVFVAFAAMALAELYRRLSGVQFALLCLTPAVLFYRVDAEILILLPFFGLILVPGAWRRPVALVLIAVAALTRELALVLFLPVLLTLAVTGPVWLRGATVATVAALALPFVVGGEPNYALETLYWPDRGIPNLKETVLYGFATMGVTDVLRLHLGFVGEAGLILLPSIVLFLALALSLIVPAGPHGPRAALVFLPLVAAMFILTVDYGRYFYLLTFYVALATRPDCLPVFDLHAWRGLPRAEAAVGRMGHWAARHRTAILAAFVLAPNGFWSREYEVWPRALMFVRHLWWDLQRIIS
ncbi:MAG: hypothetical protein MUF73_10130 [Rhodobacteraceae bacterium]|jgi:hypothetical protein|nr:hypothetical protein [Paracoccaceae bacterium]